MVTKIRDLYRKFKISILLWLVRRAQNRAVIETEIDRWVKMVDNSRLQHPLAQKLLWLLYADHNEEFRNLLYYRMGAGRNGMEGMLLRLSKAFFKPRDDLAIECPVIGTGLVIKHGTDTVIDAESLGENCLIFHDVFIGPNHLLAERPVLGNFVHVSTGARVLGKLTIGDHSVVAANAVITRNMPPNSLGIGIPARILANAGNMAEYIADGTIPAGASEKLPIDDTSDCLN